MSRFTKRFKATCPRCSQTSTSSDFRCQNCGNDQILLQELYKRKEIRNYSFGCARCEWLLPGFLHCPNCGCQLDGVARPKGWFG
jgi:hypothetical protein